MTIKTCECCGLQSETEIEEAIYQDQIYIECVDMIACLKRKSQQIVNENRKLAIDN